MRLALAQPGDHQRVGDVGLVDHHELGHLVGADLGEHLADGGDLALGVGVGAVDDVQDQVGVGDLLQRRAERLDQLVRQVPDEADGVAHRVDAAVAGLGAPGGRVQGREQRVLDEYAGIGEPVEQRGLAGVGVAGDRHARDLVALAARALGVARRLHVGQLAAQLGDLGVDAATVGLDLGLTGTTATDAATLRADPATGLARQVATPAAQALLHVAQLGQLDLRLALPALRVLGEDVEDQGGAVDDLDLDLVLEVPQLAGRQLAVAGSPCRRRWRGRSRPVPRPCRGRCRSRGRGCRGAGRARRAPPSRRSRRAGRARPSSSRRPARCRSVQTPTRMTRSSRSWRYSTSLMSSSSVDSPATRRRA